MDRELRKVCEMIRRHYPTPRVSVRMVDRIDPADRLLGQAIGYPDGRWMIKIRRRQSLDQSIDIICHEWAHCLEGITTPHRPHSRRWSRIYGDLRHLYYDRLDDEPD